MRKVLFAVALFAVAVGCSSSDESAPAVTADQACTDFASTLCDQIQSCSPLFAQLSYGDLANCKARTKLGCIDATSAPSTAATPPDIAECAKAAKSASCSALLNNDFPSQCMPKSGGIADGAPCGNDSQCKSGFCGLNEDKEICGVCAPRPTEGAACVRGRCPMGLTCSADGTTCGKAVAVGAACDGKKACIAGSSCYGGTCVADAATEGAACNTEGTAPTGPNCDGSKGLICLANKCQKITLVAAGAECGLKIEGTGADAKVTAFTLCEKAGWCRGLDPGSGKFLGTCEPAAADGAACIADATFQTGPGCIEPAECVNGKCTLPDAATCK